MQGEIILVLGGARSGKSAVAENLAAKRGHDVIYVATAGIHDVEMAKRVELHQKRRPKAWKTVEETHDLARVLTTIPLKSVVLIDCLTMWMTNLFLDETLPWPEASDEEKEEYILDSVKQFTSVARKNKLTLFLVSNEVGLGLVPDNALGRLFRDIAGKINQCVAGLADRVFLVTAGIPMELKAPVVNSAREEQ